MLVEIGYLAVSWDHAVYMISPPKMVDETTSRTRAIVIFVTRIFLICLTALFLFLLRCDPVNKAEQVRCCHNFFHRPKLTATRAAETHALRAV
jgi:hypothetical protein